VFITAIAIVWNMIFRAGEAGVDVDGSPLHASPVLWILIGVLWYVVNWINIVNEWNRRPVMFFGRYVKTLEPGISLVEPLTHRTLSDVNVQDTVVKVKAEEVQTKNNVGVMLKGVLTYRVRKDGVKESVVNINDVDDAVLERALSTLTDETGKTDLDGLLEHRDTFCTSIVETLTGRVESWGVEIVAFELKAFSIKDKVIAEAIAMKARAEKEGAAEITRAHLQEQVAEKLNKAAATYTPEGRWLKGMETLVELGRSGENNTIFIPTDLTESLAKMAPALKAA
jgi:regulator of protease activity HflC (stomatin/prohibitin superfamily)